MAQEETTKTVKKTVAKTAAKPAVKKETTVASVKSEATVSEKTETKNVSVSVEVVGIDGKVTGKIALPTEIFGEKLNKALIAQAVRVYLANQRQGNASTKTRGEVDGSTRKIYRQKGTGRARHGTVRAPIFVKGGIVFGPKPRDFGLSIPQKMKRKALFSALSSKVADKELLIVDGLAGIEPKTKNFAHMLGSLGMTNKKQRVLFVTSGDTVSLLRSGRNVQGVSFLPSKQLNTYEVLAAGRLVVMKEAIDEIKEHFLKK